MTRQVRAEAHHGAPTPVFGDSPPPRSRQPVSNGRLAIVMLIASEVMLFTTLIGAYLVLRGTAEAWPPAGQPTLPLLVTILNSIVLFLSCYTMFRAWRGLDQARPDRVRSSLGATALLGSTFLAIQGTEWVRLIGHGLKISTSLYGATFYTIIGFHGLHVLGAVVWLLVIAVRVRSDRFSLKRASHLDLCAIYWFFVCALWAVLFPLVYLT